MYLFFLLFQVHNPNQYPVCFFLRSSKDETEQEHKEHKVGLINGKTPTRTGTSSQM